MFLSNMFSNRVGSDSQNASQTHEVQNIANFNSQSLLQNFPSIPFEKPIFGCYESNAQFQFSFSPEFDKNLLSKHNLPVYDQNDVIETNNLLNTQLNVNINDRQPFLKRLINTYFESGFVGVFEDLSNNTQLLRTNPQIASTVSKISNMVVKMIDAVHAPINPWLISGKEQDFDAFNLKGDQWKQSAVRSIQWHPNSNKFAVAFKNDVVKVYSSNHPHVILKHPKQKKITCMAWKPFYSSIIAIACTDCIIIWDTDALPMSIKPSSSCSFVLSKRYHQDIIDLQWYPKSEFLLSIASRDNQIMIWDITLKTCVPVKRVGTGFGISRFSANGYKLFTADLSTSFRIWNPINYVSEKWTNLVSRCNAACWSPDGTQLLFSCHGCSLLYSLKFLANNKQDVRVVCDLSSIVQLDESEDGSGELKNYSVGGAINDICWDSSGQRLAISFKKYENESNVNVVAIFITKFQPQFQVLPCGFINDIANSWPTVMTFKPQFEQGALLTIGWSSGRIQHVPFYFAKLVDSFGNETVSNLTYLSN